VLGKLRKFISPANESQEIVRLAPIAAKLPEKRSNSEVLASPNRTSIIEVIGRQTSAGVNVGESNAMTVAAVTACVSLIADMVAKLPIYLYKPTDQGPQEVKNHPAINLIGRYPSDLHTSFELRQLMETGKGLGGNGYARVYRDSSFEPRAIEWLAPCDVQPRLVKRNTGERFVAYQVQGEKDMLNRTDIIHVRQLTRDGVLGLSPVTLLRESIGTAMTQTSAAGQLMKNGARFPGFLVTQSVLPKEKIDDARDEWESKYAGAANAGRVPILNGTFDFKQTNGMSMADAQFIESRRFELQEIARIYRIPPFMIGDSTASNWGTGIEQQTLGFLNFCLDPHLRGWEESLGFTLLTTAEQRAGYYFQFDRDELANVALEARANFYRTMREIGVLSANEVRTELGYEKIESGDNYVNPFIKTEQPVETE
jgi:HK97 family phage portal protein